MTRFHPKRFADERVGSDLDSDPGGKAGGVGGGTTLEAS